ncbi:MAG: hypothetical protein ACI8UP_005014, partial [Porticoccaceae bacterium]
NCASAFIQNGQKTDKSAYPMPETKPVAGFELWCELNALMKGSGNG